MAQKEFREPPRYMVGDIVYSHGFTCIVCSVYPFSIDYSYDLKAICGKSLGKICQSDIMHVHIWEEFLKKNGWVKDKEGYINDSYHLHLCGKYDGYSVYKVVNDNVVWLTGVRNVSDLQHLLFGLGINHEMEV